MVESYKYPVASYVYKELIIFKDFMHACVENLMSYFKKSPKKKNKSVTVEDAQAKQIEQAPVETPEAQDVVKGDEQNSDIAQGSDVVQESESSSELSDDVKVQSVAKTQADNGYTFNLVQVLKNGVCGVYTTFTGFFTRLLGYSSAINSGK